MNRLFDSEWYLQRNVDVATAVKLGQTDAWSHYHAYGRFEGRSPSHFFDPAHYLAHNPDIRAAVEAGLVTAYDHFLMYGMTEARSFVPYFDVDFYLQHNPDVNAAVDGDRHAAVQHFLTHGHAEGRPISPFFDMGAYLQANPDLAALEKHGGNPLMHLLFHGHGEIRPLGNGIHLAQFANDVKFQTAATPFEKLARIAEVAPFLPDFVPPAGWQPPADTPIPVDFVPIPGLKLVVPPNVKIPDGIELPDTFEPVTPPGPGPSPEPGPGPGPGPKPDPDPDGPFRAYLDEDGVIRFENVRGGEVEYVRYLLDPTNPDVIIFEFASGTETSHVEVIDTCGCPGGLDDAPQLPADEDDLFAALRFELQKDETLVAQPLLLPFISVNKVQVLGGPTELDDTGRVGIRVDQNGVPAPEAALSFENTAALVASELEDGVDTLHLDLHDSIVLMAPFPKLHLLAYDEAPDVDAAPKSLSVNATGAANFLYLSGPLSDDLPDEDFADHLHLGSIEITGSSELALLGGAFGRAGTKFDATRSCADIALLATIYNGIEHDGREYDWNIQFGSGDDVLIIEADDTGLDDLQPYPGKHGSFIDGGGGHNRLNLDAAAYICWANPAEGSVPVDHEVPAGLPHAGRPIVDNFQVLVTEAVDGRKYESTLLGNEFKSIELHAGSSTPDVKVKKGFSTVTMYGGFNMDVSELQEDGATIYVKSYSDYSHFADMESLKDMFWMDWNWDFGGESAEFKIAEKEVDLEKGELITIALSEDMDISEITLENGRIDFEDGVITAQNFVIDVGEMGITVDQLRAAVIDFQVTPNGLCTVDTYMDFKIDFDMPGNNDPDFTLVLENFVTVDVYEGMRASLSLQPTDDDMALAQILISETGGLFIV